MKFLLFITALLFAQVSFAQAEMDSTGLPGDHFSLEAALDLFEKANTPESFETAINTPNNHVNNLDLNEDGEIDYIKVVTHKDGDAFVFVLQAIVSETENQDVAVIQLEKTGKDKAMAQIVGDEDIYGEEVILEPGDDDDEEPGLDAPDKGPAPYYNSAALIVNVWAWPSVRFVYGPSYRPWVSPWRWRSYPNWWRPWRPFTWSVWKPFRVNHVRPGIRVSYTNRCIRANRVYRPVRAHSTVVRARHANSVGNYRVTRSKTTVTGPRGNSVSRKTTTVRGSRGNIKGQKTTVKRSRRG